MLTYDLVNYKLIFYKLYKSYFGEKTS